jgi:catechol 2,3-dioxygenase-like lactoylglutathione lyase family enzyme
MPEPPDPSVSPTFFMTELSVANWSGTLRWYVDVLGLRVVFRDEPNGFALLAAGPARLALKRATGQLGGSERIRLVFHVDDVDAEHARLVGLGVKASYPADHPREPYREVRLNDPEGVAITLFSWKGRGKA